MKCFIKNWKKIWISSRFTPSRCYNGYDIPTNYQGFCTFQITSDTRNLNMKVSTTDIDIVNKCKTVYEVQRKKRSCSMKLYYAQFELHVEPFLGYGKAMWLLLVRGHDLVCRIQVCVTFMNILIQVVEIRSTGGLLDTLSLNWVSSPQLSWICEKLLIWILPRTNFYGQSVLCVGNTP